MQPEGMKYREDSAPGSSREVTDAATAEQKSPPGAEPNGVTRMLCAAVHLDGAFADHVHRELLIPTLGGIAPNWHLDNVTLARHALLARTRRIRRDTGLLITLTALIFGLEGTILVWWWGMLTPWAAGALALAIIASAVTIAFLQVFAHYRAIHGSAVDAVDGQDLRPPDLPPIPFDAEADLTAHEGANLVLFSGSKPFIGSGDIADHWTMSIDASLGSKNGKGKRKEPKRFTSKELQEALLAQVPQRVLESAPRVAPRCGYRLFANGGAAQSLAMALRQGPVEPNDAMAIRFSRPVIEAGPSLIDLYLADPDAPIRPYTYFEIAGHEGNVVVTLFCRAVVRHPVLFAEFTVCTLRPLRPEVRTVQTVPRGLAREWRLAMNTALPKTLVLLFSSPAKALAVARDARADRAVRQQVAEAIKYRRDVDYAGRSSLRERVAGSHIEDHFTAVDETMYYQVLTRRAMDTLRDFLKDKNVDTSDFDEQSTAITRNKIVNANTINGSAFTKQNTTTVDDSSSSNSE